MNWSIKTKSILQNSLFNHYFEEELLVLLDVLKNEQKELYSVGKILLLR